MTPISQLPRTPGNIIPMHTHRAARQRAIRAAIIPVAKRAGLSAYMADQIVTQAQDAWHHGHSAARVIADAKTQIAHIAKDRRHG